MEAPRHYHASPLPSFCTVTPVRRLASFSEVFAEVWSLAQGQAAPGISDAIGCARPAGRRNRGPVGLELARGFVQAEFNRAIADAMGVSHDTIDRRGRNQPAGGGKGKGNEKGAGRNQPPGAGDGRRDVAGKPAGEGRKGKGERKNAAGNPAGAGGLRHE